MAVRGPSAKTALTHLSTFSGAGGLDLGLECAGFESVGCLETDRLAKATLQMNRPKWNILQPSDVVTAAQCLRPKDLGLDIGELVLLSGGPPCQPFSKAAQWAAGGRQGLRDVRGQAALSMIDLLEAFLPHALMIENVPGFVTGRGSALPALKRKIREVNRRAGTKYRLNVSIVDATDFGVPQRRKRAILTAFRDGQSLAVSPPNSLRTPTAWDALYDLPEEDKPPALGAYAPLLPSIPEGANYLYLTSRGDGPELFGYRTRYWSFLLKLAKDQPAWTIPASPGPSTGPFHWDNRPLSPAESLRLQTFPVDWRLAGSVRAQIRMAGNATPPLLAECVGRTLRGALFPNELLHERLILEIPPADVGPPSPLPAAPVPRDFLTRVGSHPSHAGEGLGPSPRRASPKTAAIKPNATRVSS